MKRKEIINGVVVEREMTEQEIAEMEFQRKRFENNNKILELDNWFKTDYTTYEQMFTRRKTLGMVDVIVDNFRNKTYHNIIELYEEAEVVAKEIRELRK